MDIKQYEFKSEFAKRHRAEGRAEGEAKGLSQGVFAVLAARGLVVRDEQKAIILASTDASLLERWLALAVHVANVDELLSARGESDG